MVYMVQIAKPKKSLKRPLCVCVTCPFFLSTHAHFSCSAPHCFARAWPSPRPPSLPQWLVQCDSTAHPKKRTLVLLASLPCWLLPQWVLPLTACLSNLERVKVNLSTAFVYHRVQDIISAHHLDCHVALPRRKQPAPVSEEKQDDKQQQQQEQQQPAEEAKRIPAFSPEEVTVVFVLGKVLFSNMGSI